MAFPPAALKFSSYSFGAKTAAHREVSPYGFKTTAYDFLGDAWVADVSVVHMGRGNSNIVMAWLASLKGPLGTFELPVFDYAGPAGISTNPTVSVAASARAEVVALQMTAGQSFAVGEYFTIAGHLHIVTAAPAPVANVQTLTIWPRLRADVAPAAAVEALAPYATWALAGPQTSFTRQSNRARAQQLSLIEVI